MNPLHDRCSSGVLRVITRVLSACHARSVADDVVPGLLLSALWHDESRASHLLAQAGATAEICAELLPGDGPSLPQLRGEEVTAPHPTGPWPEPIVTLLQEAHAEASFLGRVSEIQTEHVLHALLKIAPRLSEGLAARGVNIAALDHARAIGIDPAPLATDVRIVALQPSITEQHQIARVLDAAANRAREGLRVTEDYARFLLDDGHLTGQLKGIRHELAHWLRRLGTDEALPLRDTQHDVGTSIQTPQEMTRESPMVVARANIKRVQESLRTLAEFGKLRDPDAARGIEQLRYQVYTLEQALHSVGNARNRLAGARLYLLVTDQLCPRGFGPVVKGAIAGGVDVVQLREKSMPDRRLLDTARYIREWTAEAGVPFIINDRPDLAAISGADGVHVGQDDLSVHSARQIVGGKTLIGVSTHTISQARQAVLDGADYLGVGPCFASQTKDFRALAGLDFVRSVATEIALPWFALGGINRQNLAAVHGAGATRVAVSAAICRAESPEQATRELVEE